jgi:hypothetical protein
MKLDADASRLAIYTVAEGLLSALAHDLEIVAAELDGSQAGAAAEIRVRAGGLGVTGVVRKGKVEDDILSSDDVVTIERQIHEAILGGQSQDIVAKGSLDGSRATLDITAPRGTTHVTCPVVLSEEAGKKRVKGEATVSLSSLGIGPVRGPLGAFKVKDEIRVTFDLLFVP